jgi:hypothetical protein
MGLLDDAIREHLELKRLGGADPGEVAREEHDALGPVPRDGETRESVEEPVEIETPSDADGSFFADPQPSAAVDPPLNQETVEINMEAELSGRSESDSNPLPPRSESVAPVAHPAHAQRSVEDSLEWEVPGEPNPDSSSSGDGDHPKLAGDEEEDEEHVEDVLEETPDFLRDTPEQDRLWFEQRPPRDFDFNE